jgi:predicted unusual protein kinase regulating ubiquinone biosynthesis (AarF/ABC1/UbiB family)
MIKKLNTLFVLLATLILLATSCSTPTPFVVQSNNKIDGSRAVANSPTDLVLDELKLLIESEVSTERRTEIKIVQENLLKYLIEATESNDEFKIKVFKNATLYFNRIYPVLMNNIKTEKNGTGTIIPIKSAPIWTLKEELNYLNLEIGSLPNPKIKLDLLDGLRVIAPVFKKFNVEKKTAIAQNYQNAIGKILGTEFDLHPSFSEIENIIEFDGNDDEKILKVVSIVESKLKKHELSIRQIGSEIAKSGQVDMKNPQMKLIVKFMDYYFNHLHSDVIKTIMSELVTGGPKLTQEGVLTIVFQNTGPGLGKLLQQIGKEKGVGDSFSKLMSVLESSGKEVPIHLVRDMVSKDKGGFEIKSITEKPLGTGTIAQVNKAVMVENEMEKVIALRSPKPGIVDRCEDDIKILRNFVPDNEQILLAQGFNDIKVISTLIDSVEVFLNDEVDMEKAVEQQNLGDIAYSRTLKVTNHPKYSMLEMKVPKVYYPPNGKSNLHIQEFATGGVKFSELTDPKAQKIVAEEMMRMWFDEALFKSGFLNADLHQGNFRIVLLEDDSKIKILIYDFGVSSTLSKEDQRAFLLLGAGAQLKSAETIADGLMASMNSKDSSFKNKLIKEIREELKKNPNREAEEWLIWCVQKNYLVSDKLGAFGRGASLLKQLPEAIGETTMFKDIVLKSASKNLVHSIVDRQYNYPLSKIDMVKIAGRSAKQSCIEMIKSFFKMK